MPKPQFTSLPTSPTLCDFYECVLTVILHLLCEAMWDPSAYVCKLCFSSPFDPSALYYLISEPTAENQQVTAPQMSVFVSLKFEVLEVV